MANPLRERKEKNKTEMQATKKRYNNLVVIIDRAALQ